MREVGKRSQSPGKYPILDAGARVAELVDAADSDVDDLSPWGEIPKVKPVKLGEGPAAPHAARADAEPSPAPHAGEGVESRRRAPTA